MKATKSAKKPTKITKKKTKPAIRKDKAVVVTMVVRVKNKDNKEEVMGELKNLVNFTGFIDECPILSRSVIDFLS